VSLRGVAAEGLVPNHISAVPDAMGPGHKAREDGVFWGSSAIAAATFCPFNPQGHSKPCHPGRARSVKIRDRRVSAALAAVPDLRPAFAGLVREDSVLGPAHKRRAAEICRS